MSEAKPKMTRDALLELLVVILLGVTALLASWVGSLHGGNQATNYTTSNNLEAEEIRSTTPVYRA
jgi:hypothetical protein